MPGDAASNNDEELVSEIDELKARMDRLMKGGSSTSNSALLTGAPKPTAAEAAEVDAVESPPPARSRVRDLIGPEDPELSDAVAAAPGAVAFPEEEPAEIERPIAERRSDDRPTSPPPPTRPKPNRKAVGGSIISVDEGPSETRPKVDSFNDLGSAMEQELARDTSVPPKSSRKGPDLASRFGSGEEAEAPEVPETTEEIIEHDPVEESEVEPVVAEVEDELVEEPRRSHSGAIVAIWVFTAITSGTIATLHFTGII